MEEQTLENYLGMEELTREMVEAFIDCIYVYDDKSIHIQWRFENGIEEKGGGACANNEKRDLCQC